MKVTANEHFALIPEWVLYADISPAAKVVYCVLHRYANSNGKCFPSRKSISSKAGIGLSTLDRAIDDLIALEAVKVKRRTSETGSPTSNEYTVIVNRPTPDLNRPPIENEQTPLFKSDNQTKAILNQSQEPISSSSKDDGFDDFWTIYPRKVGKGAARKAWKTALKKAPKETILDGLATYQATRRGEDPSYTAHPATWLNAERWDDEMTNPETPEPETPQPNIPAWVPCDQCAGGWVYETDDQGYEYARPCICRP
jgi:hypothetical protein